MEERIFSTRKTSRADFHDYSGGLYFITVCTAGMRHYFGTIKGGAMQLSTIGEFCQRQFEEIPSHYPYASVPMFVVMPNHIHAIVRIERTHEPSATMRTHEPCVPTTMKRSALSVVIGGVKREITLFARRNGMTFAWQGRYHDHIIRDVKDGNNIAQYIKNNVAAWDKDCFYCAP